MPVQSPENSNILPTLLLLDDEEGILSSLKRTLRGIEANIVTFNSALEALQYSEQHPVEVVISDQRMPEMDGCEFLTKIRHYWPHSQRIILSAYQDFGKVSAAFNAGVVERFICKPWDNNELKFIVNKALEVLVTNSTDHQERESLLPGTPVNFHGLVAADDSMNELFDSIRHAASTNAPVFITGETGTGKELVAKACHLEGFHQDEPFIGVNCANFTEHLMESQLFGHSKGAFTGAVSAQEGLFAAAKNGTLFLDEITTLSKPLQAKLLRVIQEREFTPLGTTKVQQFQAQIISASSTSIGEAVMAGEFREDLYYRLNVITFGLPPLRERGADILLLARFFLKKYARLEGKHFQDFNRDAIQIICGYDWPGNVRQLENVIHGMVVLNTGKKITSEMIIKSLSNMVGGFAAPVKALSAESATETPGSTEQQGQQGILPLWQVEKQAIEQAIAYCQGNVPKAAALLEVSPSTLYRKKQSWE
ncbi:sigma-54-dependent transcriptional regulator [Thalassomonas actiniarum]|uniref:Sigma-54-dependent Fis family transcriptional regulator n=1 Tax=Thalassomonas actiniarum TaxID=485447 RepID=A0AAE9YJJ3_9GAMM|nr:sigma-54 dependent transcriptional regulator [Thalassomonas actiniarum]WDD96837.1 sigma-54-dependent Fis family transcriptional regulator [Thalassomonas actiniarum]